MHLSRVWASNLPINAKNNPNTKQTTYRLVPLTLFISKPSQ